MKQSHKKSVINTIKAMDINQLVNKAKSGDAHAFGELYDLFANKIFKFVKLKIQNNAEAEDALQEVFIKAYKGLDKLKLKDLNFNAWLYRIASNVINDKFRRQYRTPEIVNIYDSFDIADKYSLQKDIEISSDMESLQIIFNKLPLLYKQVLELRFIEELTLDEIATILNKSNLSVRLIQFRALKKVKELTKNV